MTGMTFSEREAMGEVAARLEGEGYQVTLEPDPALLPGGLNGVRPDAVALGRHPHLLIEIAGGRGPAERERMLRMQRAVKGSEDWELRVFYYPERGETVRPVSSEEVGRIIGRVETLTRTDTQAALLLAWAGLEAAARKHLPLEDPRSLSSSTLIDALVSLGAVDHGSGRYLSEIARTRNAIAHGQFDRIPPATDIAFVTDVIRSISPQADAA